jgi:hypothetical protein
MDTVSEQYQGHCHYLQDHRVATQARRRRLKVRILTTETKSDTE